MEYVEKWANGGYYVGGKRISLDTIVGCFLNGDSPETIQHNFSILTLEQVYGAITFYLANKAMVDEYIRQGDEEARRQVPPLSEQNPELYARLMKAREEMDLKR